MPRSSSIFSREQRGQFVSWLQYEAIQKGLAPRSVTKYVKNQRYARGEKAAVLKDLGFDSTQQLDRYITGEAEPTPETLQRLCKALGLPWLVGALLLGYIDDLFLTFQALHELGLTWCKEDGLHYEPGHGIYLPANNERQIPRRYVKINRHDWTENRAAWCMQDYSAVPNPIAIAVLVAVAYFRMKYAPEAKPGYWQAIIHSSAGTIDEAITRFREGPGRKPLDPLLKKASLVLRDKTIRRSRWIAAEYVSEWTEKISVPFARYADNSLGQQIIHSEARTIPDLTPLPSEDELAVK